MRIPDFSSIQSVAFPLNLTWKDNQLYINDKTVEGWLSSQGSVEIAQLPKVWVPLTLLRSGYTLNESEKGENHEYDESGKVNTANAQNNSELGAEQRLSDGGISDTGGNIDGSNAGPEKDDGDRRATGRNDADSLGGRGRLNETVTNDNESRVGEAIYALAVQDGEDATNGYSYGLPVSDLNLLIQSGRENSFIADVSKTPPVLLAKLVGNGEIEPLDASYDSVFRLLSTIVNRDKRPSTSSEKSIDGASISDAANPVNQVSAQESALPEIHQDDTIGNQEKPVDWAEKEVAKITSNDVAGEPDTSNDQSDVSKNVPVEDYPPESSSDFIIAPEQIADFEKRVYVGDKAKARNNIAAIRLIKHLREVKRDMSKGLTSKEQEILSAYVGWGGLPNAFRDPTSDTIADGWENIVLELESLLDEDEIEAAGRSTLDAHYTSLDIISAMWDVVKATGFREGAIMEPAMGVGHFYALQPDMQNGKVYRFGIEKDILSAEISERLYPEAQIYQSGFEEINHLQGMMDVVIGNPPFGPQKVYDAKNFNWSRVSPNIHSYFFRKGIEQLQPRGIQAFVVSRFFLDAESEDYENFRKDFHRRADLLSAVRLPRGAFMKNAGTQVVTDVLFFQRRDHVLTEDEIKDSGYPAWVYGDGIIGADPETGKAVSGNRYFEKHPDHILGTPALIRGMYQENEPAVLSDNGALPLTERMRQILISDVKNNVQPLYPSKMLAEKEWEKNNQLYGNDFNKEIIEKTPLGSFMLLKASPSVARETLGFQYGDDENMEMVQQQVDVLYPPMLAVRTDTYREYTLAHEFLVEIPVKKKRKSEDDEGDAENVESDTNEDETEASLVGEDELDAANAFDDASEESVDTPKKRKYSDTDIARITGIVGIRMALQDLLTAQIDPKMTETEVESYREKLNVVYDDFIQKNGLLNRPINKRVFSDDVMAGNILALEKNYLPEISAVVARKTGEERRPEQAEKSSVFTMRTRYPSVKQDKADTPLDALRLSMSEHGKIDPAFIVHCLRGTEWSTGNLQKDWEKVRSELGVDIYLDVSRLRNTFYLENSIDYPYQESAYALSGDVKKSLNDVNGWLQSLHDLDVMEGVNELTLLKEGLEQVQPAPVPLNDIGVRFGAAWVPAEVHQRFLKEILKMPEEKEFSCEYLKSTGKWNVGYIDLDYMSESLRWAVGNKRSAHWLIEKTINGQPVAIFETHDGERYFLEKETEIAKQKSMEMKQDWSRFIYKHESIATSLETTYNETFNRFVPPKFDGSHLELEGASTAIQFRPHQKNGVWRGLQMSKVFFDHAVGAGKTFVAIALAMEMRRLKRAHKPLLVVPNGLVEQWRDAFIELYPNANLLVASPQDAMAKNRQSFLAKAAYGDWDSVIIPHSLFTMIPQDDVYATQVIEEEIQDMQEALNEMISRAEHEKDDGKSKKMSFKRLQRKMENIKSALESKYKDSASKEKTLNILDICDWMMVDEVQAFKNMRIVTDAKNIAGLGNLEGSSKASDLYIKARAIQRMREDGGGIVYLTGTPLSNTMAELYNWMRHFAYDEMRDANILHFDAWRNAFAETTREYAFTLTGEYKEKEYLSTFDNLPELQKMVQLFMDSVSINDVQEMLKEAGMDDMPIPPIAGGQPNVIVSKPTLSQAVYIGEEVGEHDDGTPKFTEDSILDRLSKLSGKPEKGEDNILSLSSEMSRLSLDLRAVDGKQNEDGEENGGKLVRCSEEISKIYQEFNEDRGTQLVFLDFSTPKAKKTGKKQKIPPSDQAVLNAIKDVEVYEAELEAQGFASVEVQAKAEKAEERLEKLSPQEIQDIESKYSGDESRWSAYEELKSMLIKKGIPEKEIAFIHDYEKPKDRVELFGMMRSGKMRVLIGSSSKMGAGMNVQDLLVAEHHLDAPYRPLDIEQRLGRILRQGNKLLDKYGPENFHVYVNYYVTEGAGDVGRWQILKYKKDFIDQYAKRNGVRRVEDPSSQALNPGRMMAESSGSDILSDSTEMSDAVKKIRIAESAWLGTLRDLRREMKESASRKEYYGKELPIVQKTAAIILDWDTSIHQRSAVLSAEREALREAVEAEKIAAKAEKEAAKIAEKEAKKAARAAEKAAAKDGGASEKLDLEESEIGGLSTDDQISDENLVNEENVKTASPEKSDDEEGETHGSDVRGPYHYWSLDNETINKGEKSWIYKEDQRKSDMGKDVLTSLAYAFKRSNAKHRFNLREIRMKDISIELAGIPLMQLKNNEGETVTLVLDEVSLSDRKERQIIPGTEIDFELSWLSISGRALSRFRLTTNVHLMDALVGDTTYDEFEAQAARKGGYVGARILSGLEIIHHQSLSEYKTRLKNAEHSLESASNEYDRLTLKPDGSRSEDFPNQNKLNLVEFASVALDTALKGGLRKSADLESRISSLQDLLRDNQKNSTKVDVGAEAVFDEDDPELTQTEIAAKDQETKEWEEKQRKQSKVELKLERLVSVAPEIRQWRKLRAEVMAALKSEKTEDETFSLMLKRLQESEQGDDLIMESMDGLEDGMDHEQQPLDELLESAIHESDWEDVANGDVCL